MLFKKLTELCFLKNQWLSRKFKEQTDFTYGTKRQDFPHSQITDYSDKWEETAKYNLSTSCYLPLNEQPDHSLQGLGIHKHHRQSQPWSQMDNLHASTHKRRISMIKLLVVEIYALSAFLMLSELRNKGLLLAPPYHRQFDMYSYVFLFRKE